MLGIFHHHHLLLVLLLFWCCFSVVVPLEAQGQEAKDSADGTTATTTVGDDDDFAEYPQTCHAWTGASCDWEPNLQSMTVRYGNGAYNETFHAYVTPDVSTFYNLTHQSKKAAQPQFTGQFGKFINLSPNNVRVHWHSGKRGDAPVYISDIEPFGSAGTSTFPKHKFVLTLSSDPNKVLTEWTIETDKSLYYYDPFNGNPDKAKKALSTEQYHFYHIQLQNLAFAYQYRQFTGADWLALYKHKHPPRYHMWRADSFGQIHTVVTEENHYVELPPAKELQRGTSVYGPRPDEIGRMRRYRHQYPTLELQLKVISCAPRVFEIANFLSDVEVDHILQLAAAAEMQRSSTKAGEASAETLDDNTRTSRNTWIARNTDMVTDAIHRRAADVLQIHEKLFRWRRTSEIPEFPESMISIAERLQLVHYAVGQRTLAKNESFAAAVLYRPL
jgi:hypothetical protein